MAIQNPITKTFEDACQGQASEAPKQRGLCDKAE